MSCKVKICGITCLEDIDLVNKEKPDYAGFIMVPGRKRTITMEQAVLFRSRLDSSIPAVGVFWNQEPDWIAEMVLKGIFQVVQLHANETPAEVDTLKMLCNATIIKAISVKDEASLEKELQIWHNSQVDFLLLDCGNGGSGTAFDWNMLSRVTIEKPFFIAGGINPANASKACEYQPYAVDVSSGVEKDGRKDLSLIKELIQIVKGE